MGNVGPVCRTTMFLEEALQPVEVIIHEDAQAKTRAGRRGRLTQHEAVVTGLLDAAEIERVALLRGQDQPDDLLIEPPAGRKIANAEHDMAGARDAKSRVEIRGGQAHARNLLVAAAGGGGIGGSLPEK